MPSIYTDSGSSRSVTPIGEDKELKSPKDSERSSFSTCESDVSLRPDTLSKKQTLDEKIHETASEVFEIIRTYAKLISILGDLSS